MTIDIRATLPHRYPFLLVDRFIGRDGPSFECIKNVSYNEPFFSGHFPDEPVMPGVLVLEALAQAAGVALAIGEEAEEGAVAYLTGVDSARFRRKVVPGDQLRLTGEIVRSRRGLFRVRAIALVSEEVAAEATLSFLYAGT